jgi:hypothetical protein
MLTPITITFATGAAPVVNADGSLATGGMIFTLSLAGAPVSLEDSSTGETVLPTPIAAAVYQGHLLANPVGAGGYRPLVLLANDDPTSLPVATYYNVHEALAAGNEVDWELVVHHDAAGATQSLAAQRPTP